MYTYYIVNVSKGRSKKIFFQVNVIWKNRIRLTGLKSGPIFSLDSVVVIVDSGLSEDQTSKFGPTSEVEIDQLVIFASHPSFTSFLPSFVLSKQKCPCERCKS